ncbi:MAG: HAD family hydrolase [Oscillospiraceae bacterium]|nr:HAD family hydrolase [Oscillospiraceae bacterium]
MSKYELVIFDLDGTILDTIEDIKDSTNHALREHGFEEKSLNQIRSYVGNGIRRLIIQCLPENTEETVVDKLFESFNLYYKQHCMDKTKAYDGVEGLIEELHKLGIKTAVLSNKADYAVQILCEKYFPDCFDYAAGMKENVRRKPYPDGVYNVLQALGTAAEKAVYIGDSEVDILTASNAGVDCIAVNWGFRDHQILVENGAKSIASDMNSLLELIKNAD